MLELIKLGDKTYYLKSPINIGIYLIDNNNVCLIDSGNSKEFGIMIDKVLIENKWNLKYIINTHSHADHIGGNNYLQEKYNCKIYASDKEIGFINETIYEPSLLYGTYPLREFTDDRNLYAIKSNAESINNMNIDGINIIDLSGHSLGLIGIVTSDNVCFVGDAYASIKVLNKYPIQYTYNIDKFIKTIDYLYNTNYLVYVPSHGEVEYDIKNTLMKNKDIILMLEEQIISIIDNGLSFENLISKIFILHHIKVNITQYYVISATIKSFITKLVNDNKIEIYFENNILMLRVI